jgi:nicotinamidase/pyrazinamidase
MDTLVLVDIQNDFMPFGALPVPRGDEVVAVANVLMPRFGTVVATQDWHPAGHASFASSHDGRVPGDLIELSGGEQILWTDHCVQQTAGASFHSGLDISAIGHVVRKGSDPGVDSYSGFFDNDHRRATGMESLLRRLKVSRIVIAGLATEYCVLYTALDARRLGFEVVVVREGCKAVGLDPRDEERAWERMRAAGCHVASVADIVRA